jgi:hypothetical protein
VVQGVAGYDARTYAGEGAFDDVDAKRIEGEVRVILPSLDGWEWEGRVGLWRLDAPISVGTISGKVTGTYPVIGGGVRTLLWQDNAALGWRVGASGDLSVALFDLDSGTVSRDNTTASFTCDKPWEVRLAFPVSRVRAAVPYLKEGWIAQDKYTREYYGRLPVKARVRDSLGVGSRYSADLAGSAMPGIFAGMRWVRRDVEGERSFGLEGQYKDGFHLGFYGSLSF